MPDLEVFPDAAALVRAEAERIVALFDEAVAARGRCLLALSGGSTPRPLYELLGSAGYAGRIDWSRLHLFWGDERCVPPDHPESNYRMVREALIDRVPIPPVNVHRMAGEDEPHAAADAYERVLRQFFSPGERSFDLALLGMGDDGHTASIFPGTPAVDEARRWVMAVHIDHPRAMWRVTVTPVVFNAARDVTFLVAGAGKAARLREVLREDHHLPAQVVRPTHGQLHWMVDAAASSALQAR